jgi:hypothetical protein
MAVVFQVFRRLITTQYRFAAGSMVGALSCGRGFMLIIGLESQTYLGKTSVHNAAIDL